MKALAACLMMPRAALGAKPLKPSSLALIDQFLLASSVLLGIKLGDRDFASQYLTLLRKQWSQAQLQAFVTFHGSEKVGATGANTALRAIERQAMQLWLTGYSVDVAGKPVAVVTYVSAAVWALIPFTKPPGLCGGAFGYWSHPPAPG